MIPTSIPISENFNDSKGRFVKYDTGDAPLRNQVLAQAHVDIRDFEQSDTTGPRRMVEFDGSTMTVLDALTMTLMESGTITQMGDHWTAGTVGPQSTLKYWRTLRLTCATGANPTQSVATPAINLLDGFLATDTISVALPSFPASTLTLASCFIDFTSDPAGSFASPASVAFSASTTALVTGNSELTFPRSAIASINLSAVTGVRLRIQATGACTVTVAAIRLLGAAWKYAPVDINTRRHRLETPVSRTGATATAYQTPTSSSTGNHWDPVYRADVPTSAADPRPIDVSTSMIFKTGSLGGTTNSLVAMYLRELPLDENQQLDLDGMTQGDIEATGVQPDFGEAKFTIRDQTSIDHMLQLDLDDITQFDLERLPDYVSDAYIEVKLVWGPANGGVLTVLNSDAVGYTFTVGTIVANTTYCLFIDLEDDHIRVRIYPVINRAEVTWGTVVFDSTTIFDDTLTHRRPGRIGWYAELQDGDSYVQHVRTRALNFAEFRSHAFRSDTPVIGAALFPAASGPKELFSGFTPYDSHTAITLASAALEPKVYKVVNDSATPLQGISTNSFDLDDFPHTSISFDVLFPNLTLNAFLLGEFGVLIPLFVPPFTHNKWATIDINLETTGQTALTGSYQLVITQSGNTDVSTTWYLKNVTINRAVIEWSGRGKPDDPWSEERSDWISFGRIVNQTNGGALFPSRGNGMQVRAKALTQDAMIQGLKVIPQYAQLGRFTWDDQTPTFNTPPTPNIVSTVAGRRVILDGQGSTTTGDPIISWFWNLGDGNFDSGPVATHTYTLTGIYFINLIVMDAKGQRVSTTTTVNVT